MKTKIKVKGAVKSKPVGKVHHKQILNPQKPQKVSVYYEGSLIPIVSRANKRKRAPRNGARRVKHKNIILFGEGSGGSIEEWKGEDVFIGNDRSGNEGKVDNVNKVDEHLRKFRNEVRIENTVDVDGSQEISQKRGSLRLKVRPSKLKTGSSVAGERSKSPQHPNFLQEVATTLTAQDVSPGTVTVEDGSLPVARSVYKRQKRSVGSMEGPSSLVTVPLKAQNAPPESIEDGSEALAIPVYKRQNRSASNVEGSSSLVATPLKVQNAPPGSVKDGNELVARPVDKRQSRSMGNMEGPSSIVATSLNAYSAPRGSAKDGGDSVARPVDKSQDKIAESVEGQNRLITAPLKAPPPGSAKDGSESFARPVIKSQNKSMGNTEGASSVVAISLKDQSAPSGISKDGSEIISRPMDKQQNRSVAIMEGASTLVATPFKDHFPPLGSIKDGTSVTRSVDKIQNRSLESIEEPSSLVATPSKVQNVSPGSAHEGRESIARPMDKRQNRGVRNVEGSSSSKQQAIVERDIESQFMENGRLTATQSKTHHNPQAEHNENELKSALTVVKKIMRMEAAEPFNTPVDPVALGIPDYFDVIETPMDLGTVCLNLENGGKYRNSRDVYEDVQLIWINCRKYNHKGDPILELLKRVKKNFMKYWTAAGLYTEKTAALIKPMEKGAIMPESGGGEVEETSNKQQEGNSNGHLEDSHSRRTRKTTRFVQFDMKSPGKSKVKRSAPVEQVIAESMAREAKYQTEESDTAPNDDTEQHETILTNEDIDAVTPEKTCCFEGVSEGSARRTKTRQQEDEEDKQEHQEKLPEENELQLEAPEVGLEQNIGEEEELSEKPASDEPSQSKRDSEVQGTPSKSKRVSGTGHHKSDCSCVVCSGVRRKLAREGKGTQSNDIEVGATVEVGATGEVGATEEVEATGEVGATGETGATGEAGATGEVGATEESSLDKPKSEENKEVMRAGTEEGIKGGPTEDNEEKDDAVHGDEHFVDTLDAETDRQEVGGVRYYRASYEIPLRKVNSSVMHMSQVLFGGGPASPWNRAHSLTWRSNRVNTEDPLFDTVTLLARNRKSSMLG